MSRRRLLVLAPFSPRRDATHGGSRAMAQLLGALAERNDLALLYLRGPDEAGVDDELRRRCAEVHEVAHGRPRGLALLARHADAAVSLAQGTPSWVFWWGVSAFAERTREVAVAWQPAVVQLEYHVMGQYLPALASCPAPRVLVEYDPGIEMAAALRGPRGALERRAWRRYERAVARRVNRIVVFTERDRITLAPLAEATPIDRIPLGADVPGCALDPVGGDAERVLFVGSYNHAPNVAAALRLLTRIFPLVRSRRPAARLQLVGAGMPAAVRRLAGPGVELLGAVPEVTPFLDRASVVVAPLTTGGGMRIKVLDALAAGKALVASPLAVEGLDLADGHVCRIAATDEAFADAVVALLADVESRRALAVRARTWAVATLPWTHVGESYERLYQTLTGI